MGESRNRRIRSDFIVATQESPPDSPEITREEHAACLESAAAADRVLEPDPPPEPFKLTSF